VTLEQSFHPSLVRWVENYKKIHCTHRTKTFYSTHNRHVGRRSREKRGQRSMNFISGKKKLAGKAKAVRRLCCQFCHIA
jgi:hypothetical protein